ncbi:hypothetical protein [Desulfobacter latus]|uniref:Uncharacterized protein n=1 Tax=Desulfobacter latus TaxID=2292 RepID=A0A850SYE8_9BACT|nr:hypothetical protein [Desulfobacter latus]NWH06229.1 hypothetical protein [Desulfobacter latus]
MKNLINFNCLENLTAKAAEPQEIETGNKKKKALGQNISYSVGWVERSETQQLIGVGFRSSTQPTGNSCGRKYDQGREKKKRNLTSSCFLLQKLRRKALISLDRMQAHPVKKNHLRQH